MNDLLILLAKRCRGLGTAIISADETATWPTGAIESLTTEDVLRPMDLSQTVTCDNCSQNCEIMPDIVKNPRTDKLIGVFVCRDEPGVGRIEIDLNRRRQWRINEKKLIEMGYLDAAPKRKSGRRKSKAGDGNRSLLLGALMTHHKPDTDTPNWQPMLQKDIQSQLNWTQTKISRTMTQLFGEKGQKKYYQACSTGAIQGFFKRLDDGTVETEAIAEIRDDN